jgi:hypothetical protein
MMESSPLLEPLSTQLQLLVKSKRVLEEYLYSRINLILKKSERVFLKAQLPILSTPFYLCNYLACTNYDEALLSWN